jgi:hypothetical protein
MLRIFAWRESVSLSNLLTSIANDFWNPPGSWRTRCWFRPAGWPPPSRSTSILASIGRRGTWLWLRSLLYDLARSQQHYEKKKSKKWKKLWNITNSSQHLEFNPNFNCNFRTRKNVCQFLLFELHVFQLTFGGWKHVRIVRAVTWWAGTVGF